VDFRCNSLVRRDLGELRNSFAFLEKVEKSETWKLKDSGCVADQPQHLESTSTWAIPRFRKRRRAAADSAVRNTAAVHGKGDERAIEGDMKCPGEWR